MRSRVIWRRSATAIGVYVAAVLGFLTTVVATRELGVHDYAQFAAVIAASTFFQQLLDLTIEEALVKFGFRYIGGASAGGGCGACSRSRSASSSSAACSPGSRSCALAPFAKQVWGTGGVVRADADRVADRRSRRRRRTSPPARSSCAAATTSAARSSRVSMGLRLIGLAIGCRYGVAGAVIGMVVAQVVATAAIGVAGIAAFRRFPQAPSEPLGEDVRGAARASSSPRRSPRRSTRRAGRSAPRSSRPSRRSSRPATSGTRRRRRPGSRRSRARRGS